MKILFIYNKRAGKKFETSIVNQIKELLPQSYDFYFVDIRKFESFDTTTFLTLVAIGGDGTVNTVAKRCNNQNCTLGIIPKGSGDGLARFLGIPRHVHKAMDTILYGSKINIDTAQISDTFFINVAGAGFEADVAHRFGTKGVRGLIGYTRAVFDLFGTKNEHEVTLTIDGKKSSLPFFSLTIANGAQWGNNFEIASAADIQDGMLDIAIMRKPKWYQFISLISFLRTKKQENNSLFTFYKASALEIENSGKKWHIDGEPVMLKDKNKVLLHSKSLNVIIPK
ncbi:YegS/Rv2252/BmrU family lipid kinase [Bacteroidia bacterium]|nr:YegS/Rv2252/BmrU family lipid kinase [Bacteroidia bacterium]MDC1395184.1 YegS/Rv2252/BmrU family lipid kinase [Bacteroidia bacterium]